MRILDEYTEDLPGFLYHVMILVLVLVLGSLHL